MNATLPPPRSSHFAPRAVRFAAIAALVAVAAALAAGAVQTNRHADALSAQAGAIAGSAEQVLVDLLNTETGERGFLLTGLPAYVQPYRDGSKAVADDLTTLTNLTKRQRALRADVSTLRALALTKLSELSLTLSLSQSGQRRQALEMVDTNIGQQAMDLARARVAKIERGASRLPLAARRNAETAQSVALGVGGLLVVLLLALASWRRARSVRDRRERDRALDDLAGEARLERALREVAAVAAGEGSEAEIAEVVASKVGELLAATTAAVIRAEPEALRVIGYKGPAPYPERLPWDESSSSARAARTGRPARLEHYGQSGAVGAFVGAQGLRCGISVPVRMRARVWGCITVTTTRESGFGPQQERWLERFAELASAALADAQSQESLRWRLRLEEALREVAAAAAGETAEADIAQVVAAKVGELLDTATAAVIRAEPDSLHILGYSGPEPYPERLEWEPPGSAAQAVRTGRPVRKDQYDPASGTIGALMAEQGLRCTISVPVRMHARVWGCITAATTRATGFSSRQEQGLERFAELAAAALAEAQLQDSLRFRVRLEEALREVAVASASGEADERDLAALVGERVAELLGSEASALVRFDPDGLVLLGSGGAEGLRINTRLDEDSISGQVARSGATVVIDDLRDLRYRYENVASNTGARSAVAVPVFLCGELWGSIGALLPEETVPATAVELLERLAELFSVALANADAQARLRTEARLERTLQEVTAASAWDEKEDGSDLFAVIAARVTELLDASGAIVVRVEGEAGTAVGIHRVDDLADPVPFIDGAASTTAWRTGRPARVDDYGQTGAAGGKSPLSAGFRSAVSVPVRLQGRPWGYISVGNVDPYSFSADAEAVLERFAALAAGALAHAETLAALRRDATTDGLTGLLNHRAFQQLLHEEFTRARRYERPLSLIIFDLDGFKLVNDLHGHSTGDRVLQIVGSVLERNRRANDTPARVGGDEFAVIVPESSGKDALVLAERIRAAIAIELEDLGMPVTVSAGVTDLKAATTTRDLFHLADSALYHAKHHGRDRAVGYAPGIGEPSSDEEARRRALTGLTALARAVDAKDSPTQRHSERVASISTELAKRLGWTPERCARLREAALLHDVGKIGVPDTILTKPSALSDDEYERVKTHTQLGAQIAEGVLDPEQVSWVRSHHERPDGRGYPDALSADAIPDGARLLAVADAYDTMTSGRPYRAGLSPADASSEMRRHAGTQFDAELVDLLDQWALEIDSADPAKVSLRFLSPAGRS